MDLGINRIISLGFWVWIFLSQNTSNKRIHTYIYYNKYIFQVPVKYIKDTNELDPKDDTTFYIMVK